MDADMTAFLARRRALDPYQLRSGIVFFGMSKTWLWTGEDWEDIKAIPPADIIFVGCPKSPTPMQDEDSPA